MPDRPNILDIPEKILKDGVKILTDDVEKMHSINPGDTFEFEHYSEILADIVKKSSPKYSIGIYGEWGTGKTTLMALVENKLKPCSFRWRDITSSNSKLYR